MTELSQTRLKALLDYDPDTGVFTWRVSRSRFRVGDIAGRLRSDDYRDIQIDGKKYLAHRLAWFYVYGRWPVFQIDHINGTRDDNRTENLREAKSWGEQNQNRKLSRNNTSGYPGVHWHKQHGKYVAQIGHNGERRHLGYFDDPEEAATAHRAAKRKHHEFCPEVRDLLPEMQ